MKRIAALLIGGALVASCNSSSPTAPSNPTPTPTPTPTLQSVTLTGNFAGLTTPNATTQVTANATLSNGTAQDVTASCSGWAADNTFVATVSGTGLVTAHNSGSATITTTCQGVFGRVLAVLALVPPFFQSGVGDNVFTLPNYVSRVKITGDYAGFCSNFVVRIAGRLTVNEILGSCSSALGHHFEGTYVTTGGQVEITISSGVNWTFTEVRQ